MAFTPGCKLGPLAVAMALGFTASGHAAKPQLPQPWPCMITFDNTLLDPNGFGAFEFVCFAKDAPTDGLRMFAPRATSEVRYP